jgi:hypothetical protein
MIPYAASVDSCTLQAGELLLGDAGTLGINRRCRTLTLNQGAVLTLDNSSANSTDRIEVGESLRGGNEGRGARGRCGPATRQGRHVRVLRPCARAVASRNPSPHRLRLSLVASSSLRSATGFLSPFGCCSRPAAAPHLAGRQRESETL